MEVAFLIGAALIAVALWYVGANSKIASPVIYDGPAFATWNNMKHYSPDTRTVFVVFNEPVAGESILVAEVSLETAEKIRASVAAHPVQVTVCKRPGCRPHITSLAA